MHKSVVSICGAFADGIRPSNVPIGDFGPSRVGEPITM